MKYIISLALIALPILAQPTNVRVIRATHQQIILGYNAPAGDDCTIELSESSSYTPLAYDVNGTLFSGASSDLSRASTFVSGTRRMVVIGARVTDKASDGRRYSRSLQQNTAYYGRLSNCGGGSATFTVATPIQPYGPVMDPYFQHPDTGMEGHYNFPSMDITDRTESIIDPYTGQKLTKVQLPGDMLDTNESTAITGTATATGSTCTGTPNGTNWDCPTNVTATADAAVAKYNGTGQAILFVPNGTFSNTQNRGFLGHLEVDITARITGGATGTDAQLEICMGTTTACDSPWRSFTVSTSTLALVTLGDDEAANYFFTNGEYVNEQWYCTACGVGYRIRPKTTNAAYTIEIDSLKQRYKTGVNYNTSSSQYQVFSPLTAFEPADGRNYRLAYFEDRTGSGNVALYSIATDGTSHILGPLHITSGNLNFTQVVFDRQDARIMYSLATNGTIYKLTVSSATGSLSTDVFSDRDLGQATALSATAITATGYQIADQVAALNPLYSAEWVSKGTWGLQLDQNGKLVLRARENQDRGYWIAIFDPRATKPSGCATCEGAIIAAMPVGAADSPQHQKFCSVHAISNGEQDDWIHIGTGHQTTTTTGWWGGPWRIQVKKPSCDIPTQDCSITTGMTTFEIIPQSGDYNFIDPVPGGVEDASVPLEVGDLVSYIGSNTLTEWLSGDEYMEITAVDNVNHTITVKRGTNIMTSDWIVGSGFETSTQNITNTAQTISEGDYLYGMCRFTPVNEDMRADFNWNFVAAPLGDRVVKPASNGVGTVSPTPGIRPASDGYASPFVMHFTNSNNHGEWGRLPNNQAFYTDPNVYWCPAFWTNNDSCYNLQIGADTINATQAPVSRSIQTTSRYGGKDGVWGSSYQLHPRQGQQEVATGRGLEWLGDIRPYVSPTATITLTAVGGTSNVWKYSGPTLERKHYPTMAFSGNRVLRDISGPGSVIDDTKPWTYCVALLANECVTGSSVGDIYANSPLKNSSNCTTNNGNYNIYPTNDWGICIEDMQPYILGPVQVELSKDDTLGTNMRTLSMVPLRPGIQTQFAVPYMTPDGKQWVFLAENEGWSGFWLMNTDAVPAPNNTLPMTFERVNVNLYHATAAKFRIEFGYREVGAAETAYQCTTRLESCVVDSATVSDSAPFKFASESLSYVSCSSGRCQAEIPRRGGRIVFSRAKFYDSGGTLLETRVLPPQ